MTRCRSSTGATSEVQHSFRRSRKEASKTYSSSQSSHPSRWERTCWTSTGESSVSRNANSRSTQSLQSISLPLLRRRPHRRDAPLLREVQEPFLEEFPAPVEPRHHRADGDTE